MKNMQSIDSLSHTEVNMIAHEFSHQEEHKEMLVKVEKTAKFGMRYRGLLEFYCDDLIAYSTKKGFGKHALAFLRIFSTFLTDHQGDRSLSSWEDCDHLFWEDLIFTCFPEHITSFPTKHRSSDIFLQQLKRFVRWLDKHSGSSFYKTVEDLAEEALPELLACEVLFHDLFSRAVPDYHQRKHDLNSVAWEIIEKQNHFDMTRNSIFEVTNVGFITTLRDLKTTYTYQAAGLPENKLQPGMLLEGIMGKMQDDFYWSWFLAMYIFPQKAEKYIVFAD